MRNMSDDTVKPKCRVIRNVMAPMRDGVKLATTVFLPESSEPCPAVLARLPYNHKGLWGQAAFYAASSAPDTDFVARLTDVYPDGRSMNLTEGIIRARFRDSVWEPPKLIEPNKIYEYTVNLQATSNVFKKGHCIRVQVTSSNFPLWDRNLNTGNTPGSDTEMRLAHQTIHHDREHPSHILLPIVPRTSGCGTVFPGPIDGQLHANGGET